MVDDDIPAADEAGVSRGVPPVRDGHPSATTPAQRALAEAEARRARRHTGDRDSEPEVGGRGGQDPVRYGDWEVRGLTSDF